METSGSPRKRKTDGSGKRSASRSASRGRPSGAKGAAKLKSPITEMKFSVGDSVMAKFPGGSLFYPSKVVYVKPEKGKYGILFENGETANIGPADVKAEIKRKPEKSPGRSRSKSPARTPSRIQSPISSALAPRSAERVSVKRAAAASSSLTSKMSFLWVPTLVCILASPLILVAIHSSCTKAACKLEWPLYKPPRNPLAYWDLEAFKLVSGFLIGLHLLSMLPIGKKIINPSGHPVYINGALFLIAGVLGALGLYFKGFDVSIVNKKYFRILTSGILATFIMSLLGYLLARIRGSDNNPKGNTGNLLADFYHGKDQDPVFLKVDLKMLIHRLSLTGMALINVFLLLGSIGKKDTAYNQGAAVVVLLQILYAFDGLLFEANFYNTYTALNNGFGYSFISTKMFFPFFSTLLTRYIINRSPVGNCAMQGLSAAIFVIGLFLHRRSELQAGATKQKYNRINSAGGAWNLIRYPNYLGQILMYWSWVLPAACVAGTSDLLIYFVPFMLTVCMVLKIRNENVRNAHRHGYDWNTYSKRVTANLIPKVF